MAVQLLANVDGPFLQARFPLVETFPLNPTQTHWVRHMHGPENWREVVLLGQQPLHEVTNFLAAAGLQYKVVTS